jgi:hypothetical protein
MPFAWRKAPRRRGRRLGILRIRGRMSKLPLPCIIFANVQSLENKMYYLQLRLSYQRDIENCNILCCFTEMWLNEDTDNIRASGILHAPAEQRHPSSYQRLSITAGVRCLILKKSRGIAHLRYSTLW